MSLDSLIGAILTIAALVGVVLLTLWSRRIVERIHALRPGSLRDIQQELNNGDKPRDIC